MCKLYTSLLILIFSFSISAQENIELKSIFEEIEKIDNQSNLNSEIWQGKHPKKYGFFGAEKRKKQADQYQEQITKLESLANEQLSRQDQISKAVMLLKLNNYVSTIKYKLYLIPFNAEGGFFNNATFFMPSLPFNTADDYKAYLKWLPSYANYLKENQKLMKQGIKDKVLAPKIIVNNIIKLLGPWANNDFKSSPFSTPFLNMPASISKDEQDELTNKAKEVVLLNIIPAYQDLLRFINEKYLPASPSEIGISEINNGKAYYENRVKHFTTLDMTPDSVFNLGMQEVSRIKASMEKIIKDLKFNGDFKAFLKFLRTDPQFYPKSGQELLNFASWLSKKAEGELPKLFSGLYALPFTVKPVPDNIAPTYTAGRYVGGSRKQNKPGKYWVNTYNLPSRTLYTLPALTLHEAVPGHHLQITLASELENLPDFRKSYYISAFGEGWGLYSEYLGEEMGMYTTPYEWFGRYTYEMWRACRLVVDVGMHYKGWDREKAFNFMADNTALSEHEVNTEIDRYIGWPGQALSYKIGEITIKSLRAKATKELGDKFDIQKFHALILKNGSVPLTILKEEVDNYIKEAL